MAEAKDLAKAVRLMQLYMGCPPTKSRDALLRRYERAVASAAKRRGVSTDVADYQIRNEAKRRGAVCPLPGVDI